MDNIKYSYQMNMWGTPGFTKTSNFEEWYNKDFTADGYYMDWDKILKYLSAGGFKGIEFMWMMFEPVRMLFGDLKTFTAFINERGIEKVTGCFSINLGAEDKRNHENIYKSQQKVIDGLAELGGCNLVVMPAGQYYGTGPLSDEALQNVADCLDEVGRRAADKGLDVSIHNEFWCAVNLSNHEKLLEMTDPRYVQYCLDTAQVSIMGVDIVEFYDKWHERIKYLHLKDTTRKSLPDEERFKAGAEYDDEGKRWFYEMGGGHVDFPGLWRLMKKHGYKGWATVETDGTPDRCATMLLAKWYIDNVLSPIYR